MFDYGVVQSLTVALSRKLEDTFDNPLIYHDMLPMGYKEPCFFINSINSRITRKLYDRYRVQVSYDITYHPEERHFHSAEISQVADKMAFGLEYVPLEDNSLIRGNEMRWEVQENVLHFFISFDFFVRRPIDRGTKMQVLTQRYGLKEW